MATGLSAQCTVWEVRIEDAKTRRQLYFWCKKVLFLPTFHCFSGFRRSQPRTKPPEKHPHLVMKTKCPGALDEEEVGTQSKRRVQEKTENSRLTWGRCRSHLRQGRHVKLSSPLVRPTSTNITQLVKRIARARMHPGSELSNDFIHPQLKCSWCPYRRHNGREKHQAQWRQCLCFLFLMTMKSSRAKKGFVEGRIVTLAKSEDR